ncbi:MAG: DUF6285 domain-containing protein [Hyphomicrobiales bacterium]|nr:DUF6285 domain-containing protein [Hyphomicrobiales bacterium]
MADRMEKAQALLDVALSTYAQEILPGLPGDQRYTGAMIANALGIAQRRLTNPDPAQSLLDRLDCDTQEALAKAIREGAVSDATHDGLAATLLDYVEQELEITSPRFLKRRQE